MSQKAKKVKIKNMPQTYDESKSKCHGKMNPNCLNLSSKQCWQTISFVLTHIIEKHDLKKSSMSWKLQAKKRVPKDQKITADFSFPLKSFCKVFNYVGTLNVLMAFLGKFWDPQAC